MKAIEKKSTMDTKEKISILWIVIMFKMAIVDILTLTLSEALTSMLRGKPPKKHLSQKLYHNI